MIEIKKKSECCGCYGCTNVCPKQCIEMKVDNEGFWYPDIDKNKCIDCNLCEKVCPVINTQIKESFNTIAYACKNKNEDVRLSSSSGGVFTSLCEFVINNGGVVFGVSFNEKFEVEHMEATTLEECGKFRGSKYVQSKIGNTYAIAKKYLEDGKLVLFSGTPCQIKGLNLYLRKKYSNLVNVDIVCHGVPSPLVFESYKNSLTREYNSKINSISFRDKSKGWKDYRYKIYFDNGKEINLLHRENIYSKGFLSDLFLRPSCYSCKAKGMSSGSDITLADYWGIQNKHPEFDDDKGVSLILVNSQNGKCIFDKIVSKIEVLDTDLDYAISCNPSVVRPVNYNPKRSEFFKLLNERNLVELVEKYTKVSTIQKINNKIRGAASKIKRKLIK